jgi:glycosyltransferase involved in cell wall biosynthesis
MTEKEMPLVSIITPSFNQGKYLKCNIESVMNQNYPNIEHIIIDGGSTDNTIPIMVKQQHLYNMHWISEPDKGQSDALNKGLKLSKGDIIGWINSDDAYLSKYSISKVVKFFENNENANVVIGDCAIIDDKNCVRNISFGLPIISNYILSRRNIISQPSVFFRKNIADMYHADINLDYTMDYDLWLRISSKNKFYHINAILSCFRLHNSSKTVSNAEKMRSEGLYVIHKHQPDLKAANNLSLDIMQFVVRFLPVNILSIYRLKNRHDFAFNITIPNRTNLIKTNFIPGRVITFLDNLSHIY